MSSISLTLGLRGRLLSGTQVTLQGTLFGNNEPGFTFEPWDITTLYQDRAGTTPVTAAGQSVGLRLSKDQGLRQGPELVTNGDFSAGTTGWTANTATLSDNSGRLQIVSTGGNQGTSQIVPTSIGKWYSLSVTIISANANYNIGYGTGFGFGDVYDSGQLSGARTFTAKIFGTGTSQTFWFFCQAAGTYIIDNISVRELAGNHEVAVSDAKRAVYGWMPKTGRRNLLTYTEQFDNAVWTKANATVTANAAVAPDGTTTADLVYPAASGTSVVFSGAASRPQALSFYAKSAGKQWIAVGTNTNLSDTAFFDLQNGVVGAVGANMSGASIQSIGSGWYRVGVVATATATGTAGIAAFAVDTNASLSVTAYGTNGIYVWGAQLEVGSTATAYQRVASQYDITEAGVPTCYYVQADGVDDAYVTPTITPNTDKVQVFAGVRKLSDAATGIVLEASTSIGANNGSIQLAAPLSGANYMFQSRGTTQQAASYTNAAVAAPVTSVLTGIGDISADISKLRVNGVQVAENLADQGTGNYLAYPAYIYGRGGTSLPFNGLDFGHAVRFGTNLDAATIARVEALIARNTPEVTL